MDMTQGSLICKLPSFVLLNIGINICGRYKGGAAEGGRRPSIRNTFAHQHPGMLITSLFGSAC
uniref:Uncharacterized protein n=1 Tax=Oryza meridionalis TaxID=40149 RepID=A0A0E0C0R8_9ORYZ